MSVLFPSHDAFTAARGLSPGPNDGHDFGVWWRDRVGGVYRLTWLGPRARPDDAAPAGELYLLATRGSHFGSVELLCLVDPLENEVAIDGTVELILAGWGDVCGDDGSVDWVRDCVRQAIDAGTASAPHPRTVREDG